MLSESNEQKVLSRREALKRFAVLGAGVAAAAVSGASFAGCYTSQAPNRCPGSEPYCSGPTYTSCSKK